MPQTSKRVMKTKRKELIMQRAVCPNSQKENQKVLPQLPPGISGIVHHVGVVPTLALTTKQSMARSGIALRLMLHPGLKDTRVRKIY
jgi:hypothetical protein